MREIETISSDGGISQRKGDDYLLSLPVGLLPHLSIAWLPQLGTHHTSPSGTGSSRVTFHGFVAVSCPTEYKHPLALKTWCPRLLCRSAHRLTSLMIFPGYIWLPTSSKIFSVKSCVCHWHFDRAHNKVALTQLSSCLGLLVSLWLDVIICHKRFYEVGFFFEVYVQAQYR